MKEVIHVILSLSGRRIFHFIFLVSLIFPTISWAAPNVQVSAEVSDPVVGLDQEFTLVVRVESGQDVGEPDIPPRGNFEIVGKFASAEVSYVNGVMRASKVYQYTLLPLREGKFEIGPITLQIDGKSYTTNSVWVEVDASQGGRKKPVSPPVMPGFPSLDPILPTVPQQPPVMKVPQRPVFIEAQVNNNSPYVGEDIILTLRLYSAVRVTSGQLEPFRFKDMVAEELVKEREYTQTIDGVRYAITEMKYLLQPTKTGILTIDPVVAHLQIQQVNNIFSDPFFSSMSSFTQPKTIKSAPITLEVKELPPAPPHFTGLVGEFTLESSLNADTIKVGDTASLSVVIQGKGNLREGVLPKLELPPHLRLYENKPKIEVNKGSQGYEGKKIFNFALVGESAGIVQIPSFQLEYFDPKAGAYKELSSTPLNLKILEGNNSEQLVTAGIHENKTTDEKPVINRNDISPVFGIKPLLATRSQQSAFKIIALVFIWGAPLFLLAYWGYGRSQAWRERTRNERRSSRAYRQAKLQLQKLDSGSYGQIFYLLRDYLGNKLGLVSTSLTFEETLRLLQQRKISSKLASEVQQFLADLEYSQFGGIQQALSAQVLKKKALEMIRRIDKELS